jgi:hypothetical protein
VVGFFIGEKVIRITNDQLLAVWVLRKLGWSWRRIARLGLPKSHHTVTVYYQKACEMIESGELPILAKDEGKLRTHALGSASDLEYLDGKNNYSDCGGGKRCRPIKYDNDQKENSRDD